MPYRAQAPSHRYKTGLQLPSDVPSQAEIMTEVQAAQQGFIARGAGPDKTRESMMAAFEDTQELGCERAASRLERMAARIRDKEKAKPRRSTDSRLLYRPGADAQRAARYAKSRPPAFGRPRFGSGWPS